MTGRCCARHDVLRYDERHREAVLRLRATFHGIASAWNEAHFDWQQLDNPWGNEPPIYLAFCGARAVAMRGLLDGAWEVGRPGMTFRAPHLAGTLLEPDHRRSGLFAALNQVVEADLRDRGFSFAFSFSAGPAAHLANLAAGWRAVAPYREIKRPPSLAGPRLDRRLVRNLKRSTVFLYRESGNIELTSEALPEEMARLALEGWDGRVRHVRDERFFRWRYNDPSSRYRFLYLRENGELWGFLALQRNARPIPSRQLHMVDWEAGTEDVRAALLSAAVRYAEAWQFPIKTWAATLPPDSKAAAHRQGFSAAIAVASLGDSHPAALIKGLGPEAGEGPWECHGYPLEDPASWDLRMVYSDAY